MSFFGTISDLFWSQLGRPVYLKRLLENAPDLQVSLTDKQCIDGNSVVPWHELGRYPYPNYHRQKPGQMSGWGVRGRGSFGSIKLERKEYAEFGNCEITANWTCDISDIHGFCASKSVLSDFSSTDEMVETNSQRMISEVTDEKLAENLAHREIRIIHSPSTSDHFERYAWDDRLWLVNSGGSHHTAAAKYIATRLRKPVPLTGKLYTYSLNAQAVESLLRDFEMFVLPDSAQFSNDFSDAMESFQATWFWHPTPHQLGKSIVILLPTPIQRSMTVADLLRQSGVTDLGAHLRNLLAAQVNKSGS